MEFLNMEFFIGDKVSINGYNGFQSIDDIEDGTEGIVKDKFFSHQVGTKKFFSYKIVIFPALVAHHIPDSYLTLVMSYEHLLQLEQYDSALVDWLEWKS